ncbi:MAG: hypothetical protein AB9900_12630 [Humidesulfovibrio sp.]
MFTPTEATLFAAVVALVSIVVTALVMKSNSDAKYVTKEQCSTERQLQCAERAALCERLEKMEGGVRDEMKSMKRTLRITLFMSRELVTYADIPEERKAAILNNDGGAQ